MRINHETWKNIFTKDIVKFLKAESRVLHSTTSPLSSDHLSECKVAKVRRQLCQGPNQLHAPLSTPQSFTSVASRISDLPFLTHQSIHISTRCGLPCNLDVNTSLKPTTHSSSILCTQRVYIKSDIYETKWCNNYAGRRYWYYRCQHEPCCATALLALPDAPHGAAAVALLVQLSMQMRK